MAGAASRRRGPADQDDRKNTFLEGPYLAGRICYPDGHIIKMISDVGPGGANGPSWQDNGFVDPSLYLPALDPTN